MRIRLATRVGRRMRMPRQWESHVAVRPLRALKHQRWRLRSSRWIGHCLWGSRASKGAVASAWAGCWTGTRGELFKTDWIECIDVMQMGQNGENGLPCWILDRGMGRRNRRLHG